MRCERVCLTETVWNPVVCIYVCICISIYVCVAMYFVFVIAPQQTALDGWCWYAYVPRNLTV